MNNITVENKIGEYPYWLCSPDDTYMNHELLEFVCKESDLAIEKIIIDEDGVHYFVEENDGEVNNKGFFFFTEKDILDFIAKNCAVFNNMHLHAGDSIYFDGEVDTISGAYFDEHRQDIVISTDSYKSFYFSELGTRFTLNPPATKTNPQIVYAVTRTYCQSRCNSQKNTLKIFESKASAVEMLAKIRSNSEKIIAEESDDSFKIKDTERFFYPYTEYRIEEVSIIPEGETTT